MSPESNSEPSPNSLFKHIFKTSSIYSLALLAQRLASLILLPITTRRLLPEEYGVLDLIEQFFGVLSILLGANFLSALGYFYFKADSDKARRAVLGTAVWGATAVGLVATFVCLPFAAVFSRLLFHGEFAAGYLRLVLATFVPSFMLEALFYWLRVADRPTAFVLANVLRTSCTVVGTVVLLGIFRLRAWGVILTSVTSIMAACLCLGIYFMRERPLFDFRLALRMGRFAAPLGLSGVALFVIHFGDRFILPHYRSLHDLGIYVLAYKFGMLLSFAFSAFMMYWGSQVFHIMKRQNAEEVFARIFTYVVLGLSFAALALVSGSRPGLALLAAPDYRGAGLLIPIIVAAYYVRAVADFIRSLFLAYGQPGYDAVCNWAGMAACLIGYFVLIPKYGIWGAAIATLLAFVVIGVISVVLTYRLRPYRVEPARLTKIAVALAVGLAPCFLFSPGRLPAELAIPVLCLALFASMLWVLGFPTSREMQALRAAIQTLGKPAWVWQSLSK